MRIKQFYENQCNLQTGGNPPRNQYSCKCNSIQELRWHIFFFFRIGIFCVDICNDLHPYIQQTLICYDQKQLCTLDPNFIVCLCYIFHVGDSRSCSELQWWWQCQNLGSVYAFSQTGNQGCRWYHRDDADQPKKRQVMIAVGILVSKLDSVVGRMLVKHETLWNVLIEDGKCILIHNTQYFQQ